MEYLATLINQIKNKFYLNINLAGNLFSHIGMIHDKMDPSYQEPEYFYHAVFKFDFIEKSDMRILPFKKSNKCNKILEPLKDKLKKIFSVNVGSFSLNYFEVLLRFPVKFQKFTAFLICLSAWGYACHMNAPKFVSEGKIGE